MTRKNGWNYRVFKCVDPVGDTYYEIRETYYTNGKPDGWTEAASPHGETLRTLVTDLAWFLAALAKPVLDGETGKECDPAHMSARELQEWMDARADADGAA